jgi:hypothetical protein
LHTPLAGGSASFSCVLVYFCSGYSFLDLPSILFFPYFVWASQDVSCLPNAAFQVSAEIELASFGWFDYHGGD